MMRRRLLEAALAAALSWAVPAAIFSARSAPS
jgi:hypothetical protein